MDNLVKKRIREPEDIDAFILLETNMQGKILEEIIRFEQILGRRVYISGMAKSPDGINVTYSFGNLFLS